MFTIQDGMLIEYIGRDQYGNKDYVFDPEWDNAQLMRLTTQPLDRAGLLPNISFDNPVVIVTNRLEVNPDDQFVGYYVPVGTDLNHFLEILDFLGYTFNVTKAD